MRKDPAPLGMADHVAREVGGDTVHSQVLLRALRGVIRTRYDVLPFCSIPINERDCLRFERMKSRPLEPSGHHIFVRWVTYCIFAAPVTKMAK